MLCIYIGTSGWSYPRGEGTWNGYFYPRGKIDELTYYSQFFNTVEINSSFYYPLNPAYTDSWARKVPPGFLFTVKLWQKFTHPKMYLEATGEEAAISSEDVAVFTRGIEPLLKHGKLGALLAQFPPSFRNDTCGKQVLTAITKTFGGYPLAIELRHRSWSDDARTASLFKGFNAAWVQIDEPGFPSSVSAKLPLTSDIAYFRFHGRNQKDWWKGDAERRYRYLYSPEEIHDLTERVLKAAEQCRLTFAFFNNHWQGYAPRNASDLKKALGFSPALTPDFKPDKTPTGEEDKSHPGDSPDKGKNNHQADTGDY